MKMKLWSPTIVLSMMKKKVPLQARQMALNFAPRAQHCAVADRGKQYSRRALCVLIYELFSPISWTCTDCRLQTTHNFCHYIIGMKLSMLHALYE
jgi:hypothetical protein